MSENTIGYIDDQGNILDTQTAGENCAATLMLILPLVVVPFLFHLYENEKGRILLHRIHIFTGTGGAIVLLTGIWMLFLQNGAILLFLWMIVSIVLFVIIQIIDHFWADKQENMLELGNQISTKKLKIWSIIKVFGYLFITLLMVMKPW